MEFVQVLLQVCMFVYIYTLTMLNRHLKVFDLFLSICNHEASFPNNGRIAMLQNKARQHCW